MIGALVLLLLGLLLAGVAAAVGVAAAAVSQVELTRWVAYKLRGSGGAAGLLQNPGRVLATANTITTLGVLLAAGAVPALLAATTPTFLGVFTVAAGVPLFISAAYLVPRVVGRRWAEPLVARAVPWMERAGRVLAPFIPRREASTRTTLAALLSSADTDALAATDEMAVVSGVLAFADRPVRELMTPRTAIVAIPEGMLAAEAAHVFQQSGYSRYPVYRGSLDEVIGVGHTLDLLKLQPEDPVPVRPALLVPATTRAADLMLEMQRGGGHLAVVLDEHGGTAGLITFEDLLKELVGEIFEGPEPGVAPPPAARIVELEGSTPLAALEEQLGVRLDVRGVQTIGGLLIQLLGRIPRAGGRFVYKGLEFDILAATATRVERVAVRPGPVRSQSLERPEERA
ncbi:MAG TPA: hemolysin family protein [Gemmatimonadales bacterium]|jgi:CBS domain containing-hemolysin-like protein|nr:hemolysin family protein [Gemmatimonadales bacterium]